MATNVRVLTFVGTNNGNASWNAPVQQTSILDTTNPRFVRLIQLSQDGMKLVRGTNQVGINKLTFINAAILIDPTLTWPPFFDAQPTADQIKQTSQVPNIAVAANSELTVSYQWQISTDFSNWANVTAAGDYSNVTTNSLVIATSNASNFVNIAKAYRCFVSSNAGTNNSNSSILSMAVPPSNASVAAPNPTSFAVQAYGISNFTYYWQSSSDGGNTYGNVPNSTPYTNITTNHVNISNSTGLNAYRFRCVINDGNVSLNSNAGVLTVT